ncbi:MAG: hypothetical protein ACHREM_13845 [Polyangiales bacterium]
MRALARRSAGHGAIVVGALATALILGACESPPPSRNDTNSSLFEVAAPKHRSPWGAEPPKPGWTPRDFRDAIADGSAVFTKHECTRCHEIDDQPAPARPFQCTGCHQMILALTPGTPDFQRAVDHNGAEVIARYQRNIKHLIEVPRLTGIAKRVRLDWIASYLKEPYDVRPMLEESMFRHRLSATDVTRVVRYFAAIAGVPDPATHVQDLREPLMSDVNRRVRDGESLFMNRGCPACHLFGNRKDGITGDGLPMPSIAARLAPNLRFARERTRPDVVIDWLLDPESIAPGTKMPKLTLTRDEAETIVDFMWSADPQLEPVPKLDPRATLTPPKPLTRTVTYAEMKERVLGKVCVHCHMNDHERDNGPGNHGGLGYRGDGLSMRTYETLVRGVLERDGKRRSVLIAEPGETTPPIVLVMLQRKIEGARDQLAPLHDHELPHFPSAEDVRAEAPGMPLGLPAMSDEEIQILVTWIAQGCKGPTAVSGVPGKFDGFLVPDGPIAVNEGCQLREPPMRAPDRPAWAVDHEQFGVPPATAASTPSLTSSPATPR